MSDATTDKPSGGPVVNGSPSGMPLRLANAATTNGNGSGSGSRPTSMHTANTPSLSGLSRTESMVNLASAEADERAARVRKLLPEEFILPNGHPDVCS